MSSMPNADQGATTKIKKVTTRPKAPKKKPGRAQNGDGPYCPPARRRGRPRIYDTTNPVLESSGGSSELSSATRSVVEAADARTSRSDVFSCTSTTEPPNSLSTINDAYTCFALPGTGPGTGLSNTLPSAARTSETTPTQSTNQPLPPTPEFPNGILDFNRIQDTNTLVGETLVEERNMQHFDNTVNADGIFESTRNHAISGSGHGAIAPTDLQHGFTAAGPVPLTPTVGGRPASFFFSTHHLPYNDVCSHHFCPNGSQSTFKVDPGMIVQSSCGITAGAINPPQNQMPLHGMMETRWSLVPLTAFSLAHVNVPSNADPRLYTLITRNPGIFNGI